MPHVDPEARRSYQREWARSRGQSSRRRVYQREYMAMHRERYRINTWKRNLAKKYGISHEGYNRLFDLQLGKCAICGVHQSDQKKTMAVDHCHKTMKVRGLLCSHCNRILGWFKDNPVTILKAVGYLQAHK